MGAIGGAIGGATGLATGLFGTGSSQQGVGSTTSRLNLSPELQEMFKNYTSDVLNRQAQFESQGQGVGSQIQGLAGGIPQADRLGTQFQGANLRTEFGGPQFSQQLDPTGQNILSQELGNRQAALNRQLGTIGQQFAGRGNIANILQSQAQAQNQLGQNPLAFQALQEQRGREAQEFGLGQQAQQLTNQARLQQSEVGNLAQQLRNAAIGQQQGQDIGGAAARAQLLGQGLGAQGQAFESRLNTLPALGGLAEILGGKTQETTSSSKGRSGGLFGK